MFPRPPPTERDEVAMAVGRAIDGALSQFAHLARLGRRPSASAMHRLADELLAESLDEAAVPVDPPEQARLLEQFREVLQAFRASPLFGLSRPRTRVIRINGRAGIYAQPDYWDGRSRIFEMKSYRASPERPDVAAQLHLFQLAFPGFELALVNIDRHVRPVTAASVPIPPALPETSAALLRRAYQLALEFGEPKVAAYVEGPFVDYVVPESPT